MKLACIRFTGILAGFILALVVPLGVSGQEGVVVSYDGHAGFQGPLWAAKDLELLGSTA